MLSFLAQSATGVGRMFIETPFGRSLCNLFGGYDMARAVHIYIGIFMIAGFAVHAVYLLFRVDWRNFPQSLLSPDSVVPHPSDLKAFLMHTAWLVGLRKAPDFDRWGYWEKFDYWAVFWGMVIIGGTGLLMAFPLYFTHYIPGWGLNVAFWIHRIEAILAMGHVFIIHFFIGHLRKHNFPMDKAMFEGSVSLESVREEKPLWIKRLRREGRFEDQLVPEASRERRLVFYLVGYAALLSGIYLLVGGIVNSPHVTR